MNNVSDLRKSLSIIDIIKDNLDEMEYIIDGEDFYEVSEIYNILDPLEEKVKKELHKKEISRLNKYLKVNQNIEQGENKKMKLNNFNKKVDEFIKNQGLEEVIEKCNFNHECKVYIASGFLFENLGQIGLELIADICEEINLDYYLPQHADFNKKDTDDFTITNKMIANGDNGQLRTCDFVLAHIQSPMDDGVCGEISRFKTMSEYNTRYLGVIGWTDDIRLLTKPNPKQESFNNQCCYLNQYVIGEVENSLGCYLTLKECFMKMYNTYMYRLDDEYVPF